MQFKILTWQDINKATNELCPQIKDAKYITGVPRGGLIPAIMISHKIGIEFKEGDLIIDDIADSGKTYLEYKDKGRFISLINRTNFNILSSNYLNKLTEGKWVVFPWENVNKINKDYEEYKSKRNI